MLHVLAKLQALILDDDMHGASGRIHPKPDFPAVFCSCCPAVSVGLLQSNVRAESTTVTGSSSPTNMSASSSPSLRRACYQSRHAASFIIIKLWHAEYVGQTG